MRSNRLFGIDFLKTLAIIAIVIYHINVHLLSGGFIGVDLFLVISGYLLAHSLIKNRDKSLKEIIAKRISQLWPALFVMVFFVMIAITLFNYKVLNASHLDGSSSLLFLTNWSLIFNKIGYFDSFIVNPFKHLWYISVLVQSSIIITILFKIFIQINIKKYNMFVILMILMGITSFTLQQVLFDPSNVSRVYYGTDTRIYTVIAGVLTYFIYPITELQKKTNFNQKLAINGVGIVSLALFILLCLKITEVDMWIYRFGFLLFTINSIVLLLTIGSNSNIFSIIFSRLRFLLFPGKISYGIYLWHYPIIVLSKFPSELASPSLLYSIIRIVVTMIISFLSYRFIEKPVNKDGFKNTIEKRGWIFLLRSPLIYPFLIIFLMGNIGYAMPYISEVFVDTSRDIDMEENLITDNNKINEERVKETNQEKGKETNKEINEETEKEEEVIKPLSNVKQIVLIGDSTGIYPGERLISMYPNTVVDAVVSRQLYNSAETSEKYKKYDSKDTAIIFMLGSNGIFTKEDLDELVDYYPKSQKYFINVKIPDAWEKRVNTLLSEYAQEHEDIHLIDWYSVAKNHPEYLASDGTHLLTEGVDAIIKLILESIDK